MARTGVLTAHLDATPGQRAHPRRIDCIFTRGDDLPRGEPLYVQLVFTQADEIDGTQSGPQTPAVW